MIIKTIKVYMKGEVINIECESSDVLDRFLKDFEGVNIPYNTFIDFKRKNNIDFKIL